MQNTWKFSCWVTVSFLLPYFLFFLMNLLCYKIESIFFKLQVYFSLIVHFHHLINLIFMYRLLWLCKKLFQNLDAQNNNYLWYLLFLVSLKFEKGSAEHFSLGTLYANAVGCWAVFIWRFDWSQKTSFQGGSLTGTDSWLQATVVATGLLVCPHKMAAVFIRRERFKWLRQKPKYFSWPSFGSQIPSLLSYSIDHLGQPSFNARE